MGKPILHSEYSFPYPWLVNIISLDIWKKPRGPRETWLMVPRRSLTDWSEAQCQTNRARPGVAPKNMTHSPVGKNQPARRRDPALRPCPAWMASIAFCWKAILACFPIKMPETKSAIFLSLPFNLPLACEEISLQLLLISQLIWSPPFSAPSVIEAQIVTPPEI